MSNTAASECQSTFIGPSATDCKLYTDSSRKKVIPYSITSIGHGADPSFITLQ